MCENASLLFAYAKCTAHIHWLHSTILFILEKHHTYTYKNAQIQKAVSDLIFYDGENETSGKGERKVELELKVLFFKSRYVEMEALCCYRFHGIDKQTL